MILIVPVEQRSAILISLIPLIKDAIRIKQVRQFQIRKRGERERRTRRNKGLEGSGVRVLIPHICVHHVHA